MSKEKLKNLLNGFASEIATDKLRKLAEEFIEHAKSHINDFKGDNNLKHFTDAALCYIYAKKIFDHRLNERDQANKCDQSLKQLHKAMVEALGGNLNLELLNIKLDKLSHKNELDLLREKAKQHIKNIELNAQKCITSQSLCDEILQYSNNNSRQENLNNDLDIERAILHQKLEESRDLDDIKQTQDTFSEITKGMKLYLDTLYKDAEKLLGSPQCNYTLIGFGSMSLSQITPYSDLEFGIITENDDKDTVEYFEKLSHYVNFKIILLEESVITENGSDKYNKTNCNPGVNFDLGGKTPLGGENKGYSLIGTVGHFMKYLENVTNPTDGLLPYILANICLIKGDKTLYEEYQKQVSKIFTPKESVYRGRKKLYEDITEYSEEKGVANVEKGSLEKYRFDPYGASGKKFNVKLEIYRLPDRLIHELGMLHNIRAENSWDMIDKLAITNAAKFNLKKALSFAVNLKLKVYGHYGYRNDNINLTNQTNEFSFTKEDMQINSILFEFYYTVLELHYVLEKYCDKININSFVEKNQIAIQDFFKNNNFYNNADYINANICLRLLQYDTAIKYAYETWAELVKNLDFNDDRTHRKINTIITVYSSTPNPKQLEEAINFLKSEILPQVQNKKQEAQLKQNNEIISVSKEVEVTILHNLSVLCIQLSKYQDALNYSKKAIELINIKDSRYAQLVLQHLNALIESENISEAIEYFNKHIPPNSQNIESAPPLEKAQYYNDIGYIATKLKMFNEAENYLDMALNIRKQQLDANSPKIADTLDNLCNLMFMQGEYLLALDMAKDAVKIRTKISDEAQVLNLAASINNEGMAYKGLGKYDEALQNLQKALDIRLSVYRDKPHGHIANSYHDIADIYAKKGDMKKALEMQDKLINYRETYPNLNHPDFILNAYCTKLDMLKSQLNAAKKENTLWEISREIAQFNYHVGCNYIDMNEHGAATKYFIDSAKIFRQLNVPLSENMIKILMDENIAREKLLSDAFDIRNYGNIILCASNLQKIKGVLYGEESSEAQGFIAYLESMGISTKIFEQFTE